MFEFTCAQCGKSFAARKSSRRFCSLPCTHEYQRAMAVVSRGECTIDDCVRPRHSLGLCQAHYARLRRHGDPRRITRMRPLAERIEELVDQRGPDDCWPWKRPSYVRSGHGQLYYEGRMHTAQRLVWAVAHGELPPSGKVVRHLCGEALCCNPRHLALGTPDENNADQVAWNRAARILVSRHRDEFKLLLAHEMANPPKPKEKKPPGRPRKVVEKEEA